MVSISSSKSIRERTRSFLKDNKLTSNLTNLCNDFYNFLVNEYEIIPDKERIGKGMVYVSKYVAKELFEILKQENFRKQEFIDLLDGLYSYGIRNNSFELLSLSLSFSYEIILNNPELLLEFIPRITKWATHQDWKVRELSGYSILAGLKKSKNKTLTILSELSENEDENIRRLVAESLRPLRENKWLREPTKNDKVLEILSKLKTDESIYVRKSVGNNLKDLTKYMPKKILSLAKVWINESKIKVHDKLASDKTLSPVKKRLIWTLKHAFRWVKERNPEFHQELERILGKNYILYFNEKSNKNAIPK